MQSITSTGKKIENQLYNHEEAGAPGVTPKLSTTTLSTSLTDNWMYSRVQSRDTRDTYNSSNYQAIFETLNTTYKNGRVSHYAEWQPDDRPTGIMIDIDYRQSSPDPQITAGQQRKCVEAITDILKTMYNESDDREVNAFVMERPLASRAESKENTPVLKWDKKTSSYKHGFHILIPELLHIKQEKLYIIDRLVSGLDFKTIFETCSFETYYLLDGACARVPVFLAGSSAPGRDNFHVIKARYSFMLSEGSASIEAERMRSIKNVPLELSINRWGSEAIMDKQVVPWNAITREAYDQWSDDRQKAAAMAQVNSERFKPTQSHIDRVRRDDASIGRLFMLIEMALKGLSQKYRDSTPLWRKVLAITKSMQETYMVESDTMLALLDVFSTESSAYKSYEDVVLNYNSVKPFGQWMMLRKCLSDNKPCQEEFSRLWNVYFPAVIDLRYITDVAHTVKDFEGYQMVKKLIIDYMNLELCIIKSSKTYYLKRWLDYDEVTGKQMEKLQQKVEKDLLQDYAPYVVTVDLPEKVMKAHRLTPNKMTLSFYHVWKTSPRRREYDKMAFSPRMYYGNQPSNIMNLYKGPGIARDDSYVVPADFEQCAFFRHIMDRWCCGNRELYEAILNRFAHQVQKPWCKMGSALALRGSNRVGKGIPIQILADIVGSDYMFQPTSADQVFGSFNAGMARCLMMFNDEMVWGGDKEKAGVLKKLITEPWIYINKKFMPLEKLHNQVNQYIASNEDWCVPVGKTEQRFQVVDVSDSLLHMPRAEREAVIKDIVGVDKTALAQFLYRRDISKWNHRFVVQTDAVRSQKIESLGKMDSWWLNCVTIGKLPSGYDWGDMVPKHEIFNDYIESSHDRHMNQVKFWINFKKVCDIQSTKRTRGAAGARMVCMGSLDRQQTKWRRYMDDQDWSFDEDESV